MRQRKANKRGGGYRAAARPETAPPRADVATTPSPSNFAGWQSSLPGSERRQRILVAHWMIAADSKRFLDGVEAYARSAGLEWDLEALPLYQVETMRLALETQRPDGVITGYDSNEVFASLAKTSMPVVFLRHGLLEPPPRPHLTVLRLDFGEAGRAAAAHFAERGGYRSFGFVEATRDPEWSRSRGEAFRNAVAATGLPFHHFSSQSGTYQASVASREEFAALAQWLSSLPKPAAVFAATDERARDTLLSCREAGLDVPRSVAILGVNNDDFTCSHIFPNLSSVALDQAALGRAAAEELHRVIRGGPVVRRNCKVAVSGVAARTSTAAPSPGGRLVGAAMEWIDRHACDGANATEVARALGVSKSLLDLRFRELHAGSVHDALLARRLREVERLLRKTDCSIEKICGAAGFSDSSGLRRTFRNRFGMSMRQWRESSR